MADFDLPFATEAEKRYPSPAEVEQGFPCGPADRALFNALFYRLEAEIGSVINSAGIPQTNDRMTLLLEAIQALIEAATGSAPDTTGFLLLSQARARLPIFPDVATTDGKILVTSPATGTVRLPGGTNFQHRGIFPITTALTDFLTDASKTYHLRWNPTDGYTLNDLASGTYNPTAAAETDTRFDSTYDDMLIARVISNSSNAPVITNLANKDRLLMEIINTGLVTTDGAVRPKIISRATRLDWNLSRRPQCAIEISDLRTTTVDHARDDVVVIRTNQNRYGVDLVLGADHGYSIDILANIRL